MTSQYRTERVENTYCYSEELLCDKTLPQLHIQPWTNDYIRLPFYGVKWPFSKGRDT